MTRTSGGRLARLRVPAVPEAMAASVADLLRALHLAGGDAAVERRYASVLGFEPVTPEQRPARDVMLDRPRIAAVPREVSGPALTADPARAAPSATVRHHFVYDTRARRGSDHAAGEHCGTAQRCRLPASGSRPRAVHAPGASPTAVAGVARFAVHPSICGGACAAAGAETRTPRLAAAMAAQMASCMARSAAGGLGCRRSHGALLEGLSKPADAVAEAAWAGRRDSHSGERCAGQSTRPLAWISRTGQPRGWCGRAAAPACCCSRISGCWLRRPGDEWLHYLRRLRNAGVDLVAWVPRSTGAVSARVSGWQTPRARRHCGRP
jgi:hypothetical protein